MTLKSRRRVDVLLFFLALAPCLVALHLATDFDVLRRDWWLYFGERLFILRDPAMPYAAYLAAWPVAGLGAACLGRVGLRFTGYGDARFATLREVRRFGLLGRQGLAFGTFRRRRLLCEKTLHSLVSAGTQSGKTQGIVIPTLLEYRGAIVVIDPKGELWEATAAERSTWSDCYRLEWTAKHTASYNPISLEVLPDDAASIERRASQIAAVLAPQGERAGYFEKDAVRLLNALILLEVFEARHEGREAEIVNVAHWCSEFPPELLQAAREEGVTALTAKLSLASETAKERGFPRRLGNDLQEFAEMNPRQRDGVVGTLESEMHSFKSGAVEAALSGCDFSARSLVEGERPGTVYIVVQPEDREFVSPMTTALITNIIFTLTSRTPAEAKRGHSMLLLLEEFSSLKKTPAIPEAYDRGAGLGVHVMTVVQAFSQIEERYGREALKTFLQNTDFIVGFAQGDEQSRQMLAELVGKTTRVREGRSDGGRGDSYQENLEGVPLILPQQWGSLPLGRHVVLVKRHHNRPIKAKTNFAYKDDRYRRALGQGAPAKVRPSEATAE